ncbi:class I SAM-dependent methyltransferase [Dongia deserti]|uniref:class I SAM-dependent methyltransferase n=1 Tax=Dongia deserti TaxID=2268030 RepID=UPI000E64ADBD|nr:class I SAM-dependent methyltransferase [Dongia deserti]
MNAPLRDPGSFRDPSGAVYRSGDRILRTVMPGNASEVYRAARESGLFKDLAERGYLLPFEEMEVPALQSMTGAAHVLASARLPFISYPYEWSFALHRKAALLHLDLHLAALERGFDLSDASAYNVQFQGSSPIFIDHLSLRPYRDGAVWTGHRQFCMQFLNPLLCHTLLKIAPNTLFRGSLEGIEPEVLAPLLPFRSKLSWTVLTHVVMQAALQRRASGRRAATIGRLRSVSVSKVAFVGMLQGLRRAIIAMKVLSGATVWSDYAQSNSYGAAEADAKRRFVSEMVAKVRPRMLVDLGCNTGDYSDAALEAGAGRVIGFDFDHGALNLAAARAEAKKLDFLPLWLDAANPSPNQGWGQSERLGLSERLNADAIIALALVHHLAISRNIPLDAVVDWIVGLAPMGVIECPDKSDPMVQQLLALREDIFADYDHEHFVAHVARRARIVRQERLGQGGRLLVWFDRS